MLVLYICGVLKLLFFVSSPPDPGIVLRNGCSLSDTGFQATSAPANPKYATVASRLDTFQNWPRGLAQKASDLAEAGLYYTGENFGLACFCFASISCPCSTRFGETFVLPQVSATRRNASTATEESRTGSLRTSRGLSTRNGTRPACT